MIDHAADYTVIFLSALDLWSMGEGRGAPSFFNTVSVYADRGNPVYLIKPTGKRHNEYAIDNVETLTFKNDVLDALIGIKKVAFFARIWYAWRMHRMFIKLASPIIMRSDRPCLVYAYEVHAVQAAAELHRRFHVPIVTRFQGTVLCRYEDTLLNRFKMYPHFQALQQRSDLVIMTNDGSFGDRVLRELGNPTEKVFFWRNGVLASRNTVTDAAMRQARGQIRARYGISGDAPVLMTLCRLVNWKRVDCAIHAMPEVLSKHPDCKLMIVGEGEMRADLEALAKEKTVSDSVIFTGGIPQAEAYQYYAAADVFLSLYDLSNLGNPLFEALLSGKPIVSLNNGDTASVLVDGYNALLLPPDEPARIPEAILRLLDDAELRARLSANAKAYAAENLWSWEERMDTEYKEVSDMVRAYYAK